jgi:ketosteroid isomerase-like protein
LRKRRRRVLPQIDGNRTCAIRGHLEALAVTTPLDNAVTHGRPAEVQAQRPPEAIIREFYGARERGEPLHRFLDPNVVWVVPGTSRISGTYKGIPEVLRYLALRRDLSGATFRIQIHRIHARGSSIAIESTAFASRAGQAYASVGGAVLEVRNGKITSATLEPADQAAFDRFWS